MYVYTPVIFICICICRSDTSHLLPPSYFFYIQISESYENFQEKYKNRNDCIFLNHIYYM